MLNTKFGLTVSASKTNFMSGAREVTDLQEDCATMMIDKDKFKLSMHVNKFLWIPGSSIIAASNSGRMDP